MAIRPPLQQNETITVASYNCLADEFLHYWNGKMTPQQANYTANSQQRHRDLITRISKLDADVVCLQELSARNWDFMQSLMSGLGYTGIYEQFHNHKPDGIATFYRNNKFKEARQQVVSYQDSTGRKATFLHLTTQQDATVEIANTHLQGGMQNKEIANQQIQKLIQKVQQTSNPVILCGDFNFTPQDNRFTNMKNHLVDALNGQKEPTSMNGTTALRLDYIWHSATLPASASIQGSLGNFMTPEEPSDHIPVLAKFQLKVPTVVPPYTPTPYPPNSAQYSFQPLPSYSAQQYPPLQTPSPYAAPYSYTPAPQTNVPSSINPLKTINPCPGTDESPSFRRTLFSCFNNYVSWLGMSQNIYDILAQKLELILNRADEATRQGNGKFLPLFFQELVFTCKFSEAMMFYTFLKEGLPATIPNAYFRMNNQPFREPPNLTWNLLESFNNLFLERLENRVGLYQALAPRFSQLLTEADQLTQSKGGDLLTHLTHLIHLKISPGTCANELFTQVVEQAKSNSVNQSQTIPISLPKPVETVIVIRCKNVPWDQNLYARGSGAGLTWTQGTLLNRIDLETWELRTTQVFSEIEYKLLVGDDESKWEDGVNHKITHGKKEEIQPAFNPAILPPTFTTMIEVDFSVPTGKVLSVSGNGPLGNWDRKAPMVYQGNNKWSLTFPGSLDGFQYKFRLDDAWEQGENHIIEAGKKAQTSFLNF